MPNDDQYFEENQEYKLEKNKSTFNENNKQNIERYSETEEDNADEYKEEENYN